MIKLYKLIPILIALLMLLCGCTIQPATIDSTQCPNTTWFDEGLYIIGDDIEEGEYYLESISMFGGYFEVADKETNKLLFNGSFISNTYVTVEEGQTFSVSLSRFTESKNRIVECACTSGKAVYKEGMYIVGRDIQAGTYELICNEEDGNIHYEILTDSRHRPESIIASGNSKSTMVTVRKGQYLFVINASIVFIR